MTVQSFNFDILSMIKNLDIQIHYLAMNIGGIRDNVEYREIEMKTRILMESDILLFLIKSLSE